MNRRPTPEQVLIEILLLLFLAAGIRSLVHELRKLDPEPEPENGSVPPRVHASLAECGRILRRINEKEAAS